MRFVYQKVIELRDYPAVFRGQTVSFNSEPVGRYRVAVQDPLSNDLVPVGEVRGKEGAEGSTPGCVTFSLRLCNVSHR
jgi:hypothetical protein